MTSYIFIILSIFVFSTTTALELELMKRLVSEFASELRKELSDLPLLIPSSEEGSGEVDLDENLLNLDDNLITDTHELETTILSTEEPSTTTPTTTTSTTTTTTTTTTKPEPVCEADKTCLSDAECGSFYSRKNRCMGSALGRCNCSTCFNGKTCESDSDCGGLRTACRNGFCQCSQALGDHGFYFMIDAILNFCNQKKCTPEGDNCHGLPCNVGKCKCT